MSRISLLKYPITSVNTEEKLKRFSPIENSDNKLSEIHKSLSTEATNKTHKILSLASSSITAAAGVFMMAGFTDFVNINKNIQNIEISGGLNNKEFESLLLSSSDDLKCFSGHSVSDACELSKGAAESFIYATRLDPVNYKLYGSAARAYFHARMYDEALKAAKKATQLNPKYAEGHGYIALVCGLAGNIKEAEEAFKTAIQLGANDEIRHFYETLMRGAKAELRESIKCATQLEPTNYELYGCAAHSFMSLGLLDEALEAAKKSIQLNPKYALGYAYIGWLYGLQQKYKEAAEALKKALAMNGNDGLIQSYYEALRHSIKTAYNQLIVKRDKALAVNNYPYATECLRKGCELEAILVSYKSLKSLPLPCPVSSSVPKADACELSKGAAESFIYATRLDPMNYKLYGSAARAYFHARMYDETLKAAKKAIQLNPKYTQGHGYIALVCGLTGNIKEAEEPYKTAVQFTGNNDIRLLYETVISGAKTEAKRLDSVAREAIKVENYLYAAECFKKATHLDPNNFKLFGSAAAAYLCGGNIDKAIKVATKLTESNPMYAQGFVTLGRAYALKKDYKKALEVFTKGLELHGSNKVLQGEHKTIMKILSASNM